MIELISFDHLIWFHRENEDFDVETTARQLTESYVPSNSDIDGPSTSQENTNCQILDTIVENICDHNDIEHTQRIQSDNDINNENFNSTSSLMQPHATTHSNGEVNFARGSLKRRRTSGDDINSQDNLNICEQSIHIKSEADSDELETHERWEKNKFVDNLEILIFMFGFKENKKLKIFMKLLNLILRLKMLHQHQKKAWVTTAGGNNVWKNWKLLYKASIIALSSFIGTSFFSISTNKRFESSRPSNFR